MMRDSSGLALGTGSSADNVNYGDPKEQAHASADPHPPINPSLKGETPNIAQQGLHALNTEAETRWSKKAQVLLFQHDKCISSRDLILQKIFGVFLLRINVEIGG